MKKQVFCAAEKNIAQGVDFVRQALQEWRIPSKTIAATLLTMEDLLAQLVRTAGENGEITVKLFRLFGAVDIKLSCLGSGSCGCARKNRESIILRSLISLETRRTTCGTSVLWQ